MKGADEGAIHWEASNDLKDAGDKMTKFLGGDEMAVIGADKATKFSGKLVGALDIIDDANLMRLASKDIFDKNHRYIFYWWRNFLEPDVT